MSGRQLPVCRQSLDSHPAPANEGHSSYWQTGQEPGRESERGEQQAERGRDATDRQEEQGSERLVVRETKRQEDTWKGGIIGR